MPRNKMQRGDVRYRIEGSHMVYGGSKHASSFIVASLARNAVRLTALSCPVLPCRCGSTSTATVVLLPPGFLFVTDGSPADVSCGRRALHEHEGRASVVGTDTCLVEVLPAAGWLSRSLSERKDRAWSSPKLLYGLYTVPAPQLNVVAAGLDPLELLTYAPQPRRSLNVITQASPGYHPSQPTIQSIWTPALMADGGRNSSWPRFRLIGSGSLPSRRIFPSFSKRAPKAEESPQWPVPPSAPRWVARKTYCGRHNTQARCISSSVSSTADRRGWVSRITRPCIPTAIANLFAFLPGRSTSFG